MSEEYGLGRHGKDIVTKVEGTIVGYTKWLYGCNRIGLEIPPKDKVTKSAHETFDFQRIEVTGKPVFPVTLEEDILNLGSEVEDKISGFKGIIVAKTYWLAGMVDVLIEPTKLNKTGEIIEPAAFNSKRIKVIKDSAPPISKSAAGKPAPGGPQKPFKQSNS